MSKDFNPETRAAAMQRMLQVGGDSFAFEMERDLKTIDRDGLAVTFSDEAMEKLSYEMIMYVGTRIFREWKRTGIAPQAMTVTVHVNMDGAAPDA